MGLVLSRKPGESIVIDGKTTVTVHGSHNMRVVVEAPSSVSVIRSELLKRKHVQDRVATPEGESGQQEANTHDA